MIIVEETEFYTKFEALKKDKGLKWSAFSGIIGKTDDATRMAFQNQSLKEYERNLIEKHFGGGGKVSFSDGKLSIEKEGVEFTLDEIATFASHNQEEFFSHNYFANFIDLMVNRELNKLLRDPKLLDKFLNGDKS